MENIIKSNKITRFIREKLFYLDRFTTYNNYSNIISNNNIYFIDLIVIKILFIKEHIIDIFRVN